ncbi:hypothetical protein T440DRAFT_467810 [Plenodomus tracheiphilus IPT5]|uniref:Rhodopsin domain-containing protein n=1 Tax=Plenodomus tracheiphilus IPT5 TaxID=1408161 RepID=A0A6A7B8B0_9PLEO|nr:hypothetical protein T440DRAFT_467810 [Plenodomus tracheiphilus IPT5]
MAVDYFANPPPGIDLNESRTARNNAIGIVLFVLSLVFVALRLFTRVRFKRERLGSDDYFMFLGLALNAANLACCIAGGFYGLGKHIWSLGPYEMQHITIITFIYVFIYTWSVCVIKFSIIALYRRIFGLTWLGWFCIALTSAYLLINHIVLPLYTRPLHYYWNQWYGAKGVVQVNEAKFYLGMGVVNLFGDICILAVPVSSVLKLQMGRTQKIAICLMFLLGSFVCFASLYRIITITRLVRTTDISWAKSDVFIWSSVEPSIGIISGCLPTLRPLLTHVIKAVTESLPSSVRKCSQHTESQSPSVNPLETISKKRTRKIQIQDDLEGTTIDNQGDIMVTIRRRSWIKSMRPHEHSSSWRPDEDEMCLTTTTVHGTDKDGVRDGFEETIKEGHEDRGITMTTEFDWDEERRSRGTTR